MPPGLEPVMSDTLKARFCGLRYFVASIFWAHDCFGCPHSLIYYFMNIKPGRAAQYLLLTVASLSLAGCGTVVAVADAVGTATVYAVETAVNTVDAVTPDIVNGDDDDD